MQSVISRYIKGKVLVVIDAANFDVEIAVDAIEMLDKFSTFVRIDRNG